MATPVEIILRKRQGKQLTSEDIRYFVESFLAGTIPDYQMSSLLMAIFFQGMIPDEIGALTETYINSGIRMGFPEEMITVDKHSTGGVGDKVTIVLAPIIAACGAYVPMISGRGLGHTGGTLDKLEAIPGLSTQLDETRFKQLVAEVGFAIASQTRELVPADGRIYALRDVTATVESLPLITASIMSKKIAEGARNLVIDLKVGSGAFMKTMDQAEALARLLAMTGNRLGQRVSVVFSDMNAPLGYWCGNAVEVQESVDYLRGADIPDLDLLTRTLAVEMLLLCGIAGDEQDAGQRVDNAIRSGAALECFRRFIRAQGGDERVCDDPGIMAKAPVSVELVAPADGWITGMDTQAIGYALVDLGAGRKTLDSTLDYTAGAKIIAKPGDRVTMGQPIGEVCGDSPERCRYVAAKIQSAIAISADCSPSFPLIRQIWRDPVM